MNLAQFFDHWGIAENPFRGEEARHDAVFARLAEVPADDRAATGIGTHPRATHSDFEKILGNLARPSTSIVFGEKGSGKTAIRLQIEDSVDAFNQAHTDNRVFLIAYDDLNGVLDHLHQRSGNDKPEKTFSKIRLVDHIDAMLSSGVTRLVGEILEPPAEGSRAVRKAARKLSGPARDDLLILQSIYDAELTAAPRTARLRKLVARSRGGAAMIWNAALFAGWLIPLGFVLAAALYFQVNGPWVLYVFLGLLATYLTVIFKILFIDKFLVGRLGSKLSREIASLPRAARSYADSLSQLPTELVDPDVMPMSSSDETRYGMIDRFRRVLRELGYSSLLVVIDRVDEPMLVNGDADRMKSIIWPLLNNKFLQQDGFAVKMLLPIELRHALYKESSRFFQEARLDKQNLVERLTWSGAMLYDLAEARLRACKGPARGGEEEDQRLLDLFAEDVTRQDLVDALNQMHQPRDAFKFLYQCLTEHCSNVTAGEESYRVPKLVLDNVRKQQADRVQALYRGISPA